MSTTDWIIVAGAISAGFVVGMIVSRLIVVMLGAPTRPEPLQQAAGPLSSLGLWTCVIIGLLVALGIMAPDALSEMPKDLIAFLPKLLSAAIVVIAANVLSAFATAALAKALGRASSTVQRQAVSITRASIMALAVLIAVPQLGIDTTVINLGVAAVFFGLAASFTLLVGLGGRNVASQVASTRAVKRMVQTGDEVALPGGDRASVDGTVIALHPTAVEVETSSGRKMLVPSSRFLAETVTIKRSETPVEVSGEED